MHYSADGTRLLPGQEDLTGLGRPGYRGREMNYGSETQKLGGTTGIAH